MEWVSFNQSVAFLSSPKGTIHEFTRNRTKKARCFVSLRVSSWIVRSPSKQKNFKMTHYLSPSSYAPLFPAGFARPQSLPRPPARKEEELVRLSPTTNTLTENFWGEAQAS